MAAGWLRTATGRWRIALAVLLVAVAFRVYGWILQQYARHIDVAVYSLIARDIARGEDWPVFYWGQEYMGVLESWLAAGFVRVLGESPWVWGLGSTLLGIASLLVVFLWGRRIGGAACAATAVAWLTIGPGPYLRFHTRLEAYAAIVLLNLLVLWRIAAAVERWRAEGRLGYRDLFLVGLFGGLAWWCSPLSVAALLAAALLLVLFLRARIFRPELLAGAAGFVLGSLPWWIWNFRNDFRSMGMAQRIQPAGYVVGLRQLFGRTIPSTLGPSPLGPATGGASRLIEIVVLLIVFAALLVFLARLTRRIARPDRGAGERRLPSLVLLPLFLVCTVLIFVMSRYGQAGGQEGSSRYLFAAFTAFSLILGTVVATAAQAGWRWRWMAGAALALLISVQWPNLRLVQAFANQDREYRRQAHRLAQDLRTAGVEAMYVNRFRIWLNVALGDEFLFWLPGGRHPSYWARLEASRHPAVAEDFTRVTAFLATVGGKARLVDQPPDLPYWFDFQPPAVGRREITPDRWTISAVGAEDTVISAIADRAYQTAWELTPGEERDLEITFAEETTINSVRLVHRGDRMFKHFGVQAWDGEARTWMDVTDFGPLSEGMWVGDRPYWGGVYRWVEVRFPPVRGARLRLRCLAHRNRFARVSEIILFEPAEPEPPVADAVEPLLQKLRTLAPTGIAADRWIAARIRESWPDAPPLLSEPYRDDRNAPYDPFLRFQGRTAVVVHGETADLSEQVLRSAGLPVERHTVAPYIILLALPAPDGATPRAVRWAGFGVLLEERP